jgi:glycosyltransferase involved in cell wall biosynthesis
MCLWNEEDIIESTVKHAFAQGCANVFIIDNCSTDRTVDIAVKAGAKFVTSFESKYFDEDKKIAHLNTVVKYINDTIYNDNVWWLYLDADEFPNFDCEFTIIDVLKQLDSSVKAIHGYMFDHIPSHSPYHINGYHPIDFQPLCHKTITSKICLVRYDKGQKHLFSTSGAHHVITHGQSMPTILDFLQIHHFPYRNYESTMLRLKQLIDRQNDFIINTGWNNEREGRVCEANMSKYKSNYNNLFTKYKESKYLSLKTKSIIYNYKNIVRWYDIYDEKTPFTTNYEKNLSSAVYYFFMTEYDISLCKFYDAFNDCHDDYIKLWLMVKLAECLSSTSINDAHDIIYSVQAHNHVEINDYIDNNFGCFDLNQIINFKDMIVTVEYLQSVFTDGSEVKFTEMMNEIETLLSQVVGEKT